VSAAKGTGQRNDAVEAAVHAALDRIDAFIAGDGRSTWRERSAPHAPRQIEKPKRSG